MEFFAIAILLIIVLVTVRILVRRALTGGGPYIEIFETTSMTMRLPRELTDQLEDEGVRYRTVRKGGLNQPFTPHFGPEFVALEVHIEDLEKGRRAVSKMQSQAWRNRDKKDQSERDDN